MNRIIAISMVKNEADIIESMVRYTLNYADYLLIKEHNSTDDTRKILELLKEEGLALEIYDCNVEGHNQSDVMTELVYKYLPLRRSKKVNQRKQAFIMSNIAVILLLILGYVLFIRRPKEAKVPSGSELSADETARLNEILQKDETL